MVAASVAAGQCRELQRHGVHDFHFYTLNRADLTVPSAICWASARPNRPWRRHCDLNHPTRAAGDTEKEAPVSVLSRSAARLVIALAAIPVLAAPPVAAETQAPAPATVQALAPPSGR